MANDALLFATWVDADEWAESLWAGGVPVRRYPQEFEGKEGDLANIRFAVCWKPPPGLLSKCTSLRGIQSLGAGVDHLLGVDLVPPNVPVARIVDPLMSQRMATWVLWGVINIQRRMDAYWQAQLERRWDQTVEPRGLTWDNANVRVGVMGVGGMGGTTATMLHNAGFKVTGWSRTDSDRCRGGGFARVSGLESLPDFLATTDILVCLLPLTPETNGIINAKLLAALPAGASVINAARGAHVVEEDLLQALDSGHIRHAILDVTTPEPLPASSRLWTHPSVRITPHVSAMTNTDTALQQIIENYKRTCQGVPMANLVDIQRGY